jgi:hypothetical protein
MVSSPGANTLAGELSAANRAARWTDISFSVSSSAARVVRVSCRRASLVPPPAAALNMFAGLMTKLA